MQNALGLLWSVLIISFLLLLLFSSVVFDGSVPMPASVQGGDPLAEGAPPWSRGPGHLLQYPGQDY